MPLFLHYGFVQMDRKLTYHHEGMEDALPGGELYLKMLGHLLRDFEAPAHDRRGVRADWPADHAGSPFVEDGGQLISPEKRP